MKTKKIYAVVSLVVLGLLLSTILVSGFGWVRAGNFNIKLGAANPPVNLNADANSFSQAFIEVAEKVTPSIVQITVVSTREENPHEDFFFFPFKDFEIPKEQQGSGSGIIITEDGYILTNNHVVENAKSIKVGLSDKRTFNGELIGTDPLTDLAVIKIDAKGLIPAYLGDSDKLKVGQWVMAIGNPLSLASTVTAGIISALNRGQLRLIQDSYGVENFIQTDAAINPGNSGGALVDLSGAVIGVNTAIATRTGTYIGYGFAIPINLAKSVSKDLIANGKVNRGYIGVQIREVDDAIAKSIGLDKPKGVLIEKVMEGGAASKTDIKEGDVILKVDDHEVNLPNELQSYIASKPAGSQVTLLLFRDGKEITRQITLQAREGITTKNVSEKDSKGNEKDESNLNSATFDNIGLTVRNLTKDEKSQFNIDGGVIITDVKPFSPAADKGLGEGLVIVKADKKDINNVSELKKIVDSKKGSAVLLLVKDDKGNNRYVGLDVPNK